ncbi:MAG: YetF domain-containing protein [Cyanobacteria bacterium J06626_18]
MFNSWSSLAHKFMAGSLGYLVIIFLLRISGKRTLSKWNSFDFVVTIAFGSILAAMLLSKDTSLVQASLGFGLLVLYQFILTWVATRSDIVQSLIKAEPTLLLYKGQFRQKALKHERVAEGEVLAAVRSQGMGDIAKVDAVVLETDGSFSVIKNLESASALSDVQGFMGY